MTVVEPSVAVEVDKLTPEVLGIVSSVPVPLVLIVLTFPLEKLIPILPDTDIQNDFVPSELCGIFTV